jgi:hypothetical protein
VREELEQEIQGAAVEAQIADLLDGAEVTRTQADAIDTSLLKSLELLTE